MLYNMFETFSAYTKSCLRQWSRPLHPYIIFRILQPACLEVNEGFLNLTLQQQEAVKYK